MNRALLFGALSGAVLLLGQGDQDRIFVDFQEVMIPMRDGVRLQTVLLKPKNAKGPLPFLIDRTPYGVPSKELVDKGLSAGQRWRRENYIFVAQNIRGRFESEGKFVMFRPPHDPKDAKGVDETTDAWDTVDWLIKNVPNNNGTAGIAGTSYDGWTAVMASLNPHPALKAAIEQASPADQFLGDDFHHNGAFRLSYGFEYSAMLETSSTANYRFEFDRADTYDWYLGLGALSNADEKYFHGKVPTWTDFTRHPNYDAFWQKQAFAPYLTSAEMADHWGFLESRPCWQSISPDERRWYALFKAVGLRDGRAMSDHAQALLLSPAGRSGVPGRYVTAAAMLGELASGDRKRAREIWTRVAAPLLGGSPPELLFQVLAAESDPASIRH